MPEYHSTTRPAWPLQRSCADASYSGHMNTIELINPGRSKRAINCQKYCSNAATFMYWGFQVESTRHMPERYERCHTDLHTRKRAKGAVSPTTDPSTAAGMSRGILSSVRPRYKRKDDLLQEAVERKAAPRRAENPVLVAEALHQPRRRPACGWPRRVAKPPTADGALPEAAKSENTGQRGHLQMPFHSFSRRHCRCR
jgi:hypothetical protein